METRAGTTGIYTNPFGDLITGRANSARFRSSRFSRCRNSRAFFSRFSPAHPAVTGGDTIVFKGNYTADNIGKTGVYYRTLQDAAYR